MNLSDEKDFSKFKKFLEQNTENIVDLVERKKLENVFDLDITLFNLVRDFLQKELPLGRDNEPWLDKAHQELALAIIYSMWCGWLSQAKANRGIYSKEYVELFKKLIINAFTIGQEYSKNRP